jgi:hypothetical protein
MDDPVVVAARRATAFFELGQFRDTLYHAHEVAFSAGEVEAMIRDAGCELVAAEDQGSRAVYRMRSK